MLAQVEHRLWTVEDYYAMAESGILNADDHVELIEGGIIRMSPIGVRHMGCVNTVNEEFVPRFRGKAIVSIQNPVRLNDLSEPVPDIVLLKYRSDRYRRHMPTAEDVLLLIEVADSTIPYDRRVKRPLYAQAGIPEYWLMNLVDNVIEVHRRPEGDSYTEMFTVYQGDVIAAEAFPEIEFEVGALIG